MDTDVSTPTTFGLTGEWNWLGGGALAGVIGSLAFGALTWMLEPTIVTVAIPAIYGLAPSSTLGWALHIGHGLVLGSVFGYIVSRDPVLGALAADVATPILATTGIGTRLTLAGVVYGLAIWGLLPIVGVSLAATIGIPSTTAFTGTAKEMLAGHLLYGLLVGALFSAVVDLTGAQGLDAPFEEPTA